MNRPIYTLDDLGRTVMADPPKPQVNDKLAAFVRSGGDPEYLVGYCKWLEAQIDFWMRGDGQ